MTTRITIIGMGALGTSLGLALKAGTTPLEIVGHDRLLEQGQAAQRCGALDRYEWNLINAVSGTDLVILALPLAAIEETLRHIGPELREDCVVTDTANLKGPVMDAARRLLPRDIHFVGGNPLVQTTGQGPEAASPTLFQGRRYALTPLADTNPDAINLVTSIVSIVGAEPLFMDAAEHDGLAAAVTQLPAVLSVALLRATTEHAGWREMSKMAGTPYADATRLPADQAPDLRALLLANPEPLQRWLDAIQTELGRVQRLLASGGVDEIEQMLADLLVARARWAETNDIDRPAAAIEEAEEGRGFGSLFSFGRRRRSSKK